MMKNYYNEVKVFKYEGEDHNGWGCNRGRSALVLNGDTVAVKHISGADVHYWSLLKFILQDKDLKMMIRDFTMNGHRKNPCHIYEKFGVSGCSDVYVDICTACADKYVVSSSKHLLHISCFGKIHELPEMWIGDFIELVAHTITKEELVEIKDTCHYCKGIVLGEDDNIINESSNICDWLD